MLLLLALLSATPGASAAPAAVPSRQIPASVLVELAALENRFELALAADCASDQCYSNGCVYVDHQVADRPRARSMPGLATEAGPSDAASQEYLTRAQCAFSHEASVDSADAAAIVRRLQTRMSQGWTVVTVEHQALPVIPSTVAAPAAEQAPPVEAPVEAPPQWSAEEARHELWSALLPHAWWMVGLGLLPLSSMALIWAWRRVGRASLEEQAMLAQLALPAEAVVREEGADEAAPSAEQADLAYVAAQDALWRARLSAIDADHPDPELSALLRERLQAGDLPLLAKAMLRFPEGLPAAFPVDGETAATKLDLAELLQTVDDAALPSDAAFFRALERHALAATLASQPDAAIVRSLRREFGSSGLVDLLGRLPARLAALLFALAPPGEQIEAARLLSDRAVTAMARQLLRSNRMDAAETAALFEVLRGARGVSAADLAPPTDEISDRGTPFDAAGALAVLLPRLAPQGQAALFDEALGWNQGGLPRWHRDIFVPSMLLALDASARADLLLAIDADPLAAWFSLVEPAQAAALLDGAPDALRLSIQAAAPPPSRAAQLSRAAEARRALARGFQRQLSRAGISFEAVVRGGSALR